MWEISERVVNWIVTGLAQFFVIGGISDGKYVIVATQESR